MNLQKSILTLAVFFMIISLASTIFAKDDNAIQNAGEAISNVAKDAGSDMKEDMQNAGNTVRNGAESVGNGVKNVAGNIGNTVESGINQAADTMDNENNNYTAARMNTEGGTFMGMNPMTWVWLSLAVAAVIIVALVWRYGSQNNYHQD